MISKCILGLYLLSLPGLGLSGQPKEDIKTENKPAPLQKQDNREAVESRLRVKVVQLPDSGLSTEVFAGFDMESDKYRISCESEPEKTACREFLKQNSKKINGIFYATSPEGNRKIIDVSEAESLFINDLSQNSQVSSKDVAIIDKPAVRESNDFRLQITSPQGSRKSLIENNATKQISETSKGSGSRTLLTMGAEALTIGLGGIFAYRQGWFKDFNLRVKPIEPGSGSESEHEQEEVSDKRNRLSSNTGFVHAQESLSKNTLEIAKQKCRDLEGIPFLYDLDDQQSYNNDFITLKRPEETWLCVFRVESEYFGGAWNKLYRSIDLFYLDLASLLFKTQASDIILKRESLDDEDASLSHPDIESYRSLNPGSNWYNYWENNCLSYGALPGYDLVISENSKEEASKMFLEAEPDDQLFNTLPYRFPDGSLGHHQLMFGRYPSKEQPLDRMDIQKAKEILSEIYRSL